MPPVSPSFARKIAVGFCWGLLFALPGTVFGQTNYYTTNGTEYSIVGSLPGDQVWPDVALGTNGGFVVWQDNATDGSGWGLSATRLDATLSTNLTWSDVRVNVQGTNDQEHARVAVLKNGGAAFVWQGGVHGFQHIYARFLSPTNTWLSSTDIVVSVPTNNFQVQPAIAVLNNGNVVVVWSSFDEVSADSLLDIYGQIFSPTGQKIGGEFLINQFIAHNQRAPTVAALTGGGFVVAWASEQERSTFNLGSIDETNGTISTVIGSASVDIYARLFDDNGVAQSDEILVNTDSNLCADPSAAATTNGGFVLAWGERDLVDFTNGWDIYARGFTSAGVGGTVTRVNTYLYGDQYAPRISAIGGDCLVVWTSLQEDGSWQGVFGRLVHEDGSPVGGEFRVNTTTAGPQQQPVVASTGADQFLAVWTSYTGTPSSVDLFAQRYINANITTNPPALGAPFVWAPFTLSNGVYQPQLAVSWSALSGISVATYEVYADGGGTPVAVTTSNFWTMTAADGLTAGSTHSFTVDYVTASGHRSSLSPSTSGTAWSGLNWDGVPYEWMAEFFGGYYGGSYHTNYWLAPSAQVATGGPTLLQVFQSGGNPFDSTTWLQTSLTGTAQGLFLNWNTQPGHTYQVQVKTNLAGAWVNLGAPRFAPGTSDSIYVGGNSAGYYQIQFLH